jgi:hypothetical protein
MGRDDQHGNSSEGYGRREFLRGAGAAAAGSIFLGSGTLAGVEALRVPSAFAARAIQESDSAHFGRIFGNLRFFGAKMDSDKLAAAMVDIGKPGGILDANDELLPDTEAQAALLITDPSLSANNPNNPSHTAGTHFVGQFFDHDLTFDTTSQLGVPKDPTISPNARTPALDLDSVYGGGPALSAQLYDDVWDFDVDISSNAMDVHMSRLRHALAASDRVSIRTLRGVGYRLEIDSR